MKKINSISIQQIFDICQERVKSGNRVLTLEEVIQNAQQDDWPLFVELNRPGRHGRWVYPREMRNMKRKDKESYNITWRAWKYVPSDEERRAHKWRRAEVTPIKEQ